MSTREIQLRKDSQLFAQLCLALLREGHSVQFRVQGESMRPNILDGDAVLVAPSAERELRHGDIALVQNQDGLRVHRVASCGASSGAVVTRSDTGLACDPSASRLFGKVIVLLRNSRAESLTPLQTRFVHPLRVMFRRIRTAALLRLRRVALLLSGIVALSLLCATFLAPAAHAQTADLQLTQTAVALGTTTLITAVAAGTTYSYTEVVKNNNSSATVTSGTIVVYMQTPANTVYEGYAGTNWHCTNPGAGNVGPVVCTYGTAGSGTTLASGATASTLTIDFQVTAGTASGTTIQNSATVTNSTFQDTVPSNNTSITSIIVEPTTTSDLAVSISVSPTPVFVSSNLTYTITVQNLGQANTPTTTYNVLTDTLPTSVTFSSITTPSSWTCTTPAVGSTGTISCLISTAMAKYTAATFAITVSAPSAATTLTNTATVALTGDPNANNNSATSYTVVQPLACATPGKDGAGGALAGIVNAYYPPSTTGTLASGSTSVALGAVASGGAQTAIGVGDLLLIIQMQDATINDTNTSSYGHGVPGDPGSGSTSLGSSGFFEFVTATSAVPVTGGTLTFTGTGPTGGLLNSYSYAIATATQGQQTYQVIRVPQYTSATLSSALLRSLGMVLSAASLP